CMACAPPSPRFAFPHGRPRSGYAARPTARKPCAPTSAPPPMAVPASRPQTL
ncbi:MAG: hypothetical protein AVDCRST_MAG73-1668, partial [uncultured Thermomicrobiales bacterium]